MRDRERPGDIPMVADGQPIAIPYAANSSLPRGARQLPGAIQARLSNLRLRWKLLGSFALVLVVLTGVTVVSYRTTTTNADANAAVTHTLLVIGTANAALSDLVDMETGYRGFLLTGNEAFLEPYVSGQSSFDARLAELLESTADNPPQVERWQELGQRATTWRREVTEPGIQLRRAVTASTTDLAEVAAFVGTGEGKRQFDAMREIFVAALDEEERLLDGRQQQASDANARLRQTLVVGSLLAIGLAVVLALLLARDTVGVVDRLARTAGRIAGGDLDQRINLQRRDEIGAAAAAFDRMAEQLQLALERSERQARDLARSNADLEQFAYVASHDLQEPLRAVVSYVQLLEKRYAGQLDARADKYIAYAVDGGQRMQTLINDLLVYSRVGRRDEARTMYASGQALERAIANLRSAIEESGAVVTYDQLPTVLVDPAQLTHLFQNLVGNAIKFRGEAPPRVHVAAIPRQDAWVFSVCDNGVGIAPEYSERIFVIFQRLHSRDAYPGTGIGLSICKKIVEQHGGQLWVESTPGDGSTFSFTLPRPDTERMSA